MAGVEENCWHGVVEVGCRRHKACTVDLAGDDRNMLDIGGSIGNWGCMTQEKRTWVETLEIEVVVPMSGLGSHWLRIRGVRGSTSLKPSYVRPRYIEPKGEADDDVTKEGWMKVQCSCGKRRYSPYHLSIPIISSAKQLFIVCCAL